MKLIGFEQSTMDEQLDCFGDFSMEDQICKGYCALRLRCAVAKEQNTRMEILEELVSSEASVLKMQ